MPEAAPLDVLAIAAHPDDIEITCAGLLIKLAKKGRRTGALDLTRGEMGTKGNEATRDAEAAAAGNVMGLAYRGNLRLPDSRLENTSEYRLKIAQVIRDTKPELVILPHWEQRHPDHRVTSQLGFDACYMAGLAKADLTGEPHRPRKIIYVSYFRNTDYSFLVDISDEFEQKVEAVAAYQSQFGTSKNIKEIIKNSLNLYELVQSGGKNIFHPGINIYDLLHTRHRQLGQLADSKYAEAYTIREQVVIDDPQKLPVRSI